MGKVNKKLSGKEGEDSAVNYLAGLGYKILHRNFRAGRKEIDIVALDGKELVFVEVKAGKSKEFGEPELRVDERKQKNLAEVAQKFLAETKLDFESCRFDVLGVDLETKMIVHYRGAFVLPEQE